MHILHILTLLGMEFSLCWSLLMLTVFWIRSNCPYIYFGLVRLCLGFHRIGSLVLGWFSKGPSHILDPWQPLIHSAHVRLLVFRELHEKDISWKRLLLLFKLLTQYSGSFFSSCCGGLVSSPVFTIAKAQWGALCVAYNSSHSCLCYSTSLPHLRGMWEYIAFICMCVYLHVNTPVLTTDGLQLPSTIWPVISSLWRRRHNSSCLYCLVSASSYKVLSLQSKTPQTTNH